MGKKTVKKKTVDKENAAWINLFLAIIANNGYYTKLRFFMKKRGYNFADMASMLNNEYEDAPDGMSPYLYMDSLEDLLTDKGIKGFYDINDIVNYINDNCLWKEAW